MPDTTPSAPPVIVTPPAPVFEEPPVDDAKCSGRPGCKSNRISQGTGRPWICDTCSRG